MIYTSPKLECLGTIAGLTASDFKCTPGGDGAWTLWSDAADPQLKWVDKDGNTEFSMPIPGHTCTSEFANPDLFNSG